MQNKLDNGLELMEQSRRSWFKKKFQKVSITSPFDEAQFINLLGLLKKYQNTVGSDFVIKCIETVSNFENEFGARKVLVDHLLSLVRQHLGEKRVKYIERHYLAKSLQAKQTDFINESPVLTNPANKPTISKKPVKVLTQLAEPIIPVNHDVHPEQKNASTAEPKPAPQKTVEETVPYGALKSLITKQIILPNEICETAAKISKLLKLKNNTINLVGTCSRHLISSQLNLPDYNTLKEYPIRSMTFWIDGNYLKEPFPVNEQVNRIDTHCYRINGILADKELKVLTIPDAQFGQFLVSRVCLPLSRDEKNPEVFINTANIKATTLEWRHSTHKELFLRHTKANVNNHFQDIIAEDPACILKFHREKVKGMTKVSKGQELAFKTTVISDEKLKSCGKLIFEQCQKDAKTYGKGNPQGYINDLKQYASIKKVLDYAAKRTNQPNQPKPSNTGLFAPKPQFYKTPSDTTNSHSANPQGKK